MRGETPQPCECAALSQARYEILKKVFPLATIDNDPLCFFEGTRVLFGPILGKEKKLRVNSASDGASMFPQTAMRVLDLRNATTMLPVRRTPVHSKTVLIDNGLHDAFAEAGDLTWIDGEDTAKASSLVDH